MADDIANLLSRFGASADNYLEVEHALDYKELPLSPAVAEYAASVHPEAFAVEADKTSASPAKEMASAPMTAAVESALHAMAERVEPVLADAPAASENEKPALPVVAATVAAVATGTATATAALPVIASAGSSSLRTLLTEVARERQAAEPPRRVDPVRPVASDTARPTTPAHVVAVISMKGGVGKSTISAALIGALNLGGRTIGIDLDPQNVLQYHAGVDADIAGTKHIGLTGGDWNALLLDGVGGVQVLPYGTVSGNERRTLEHHFQEDRHWLARQLADMHLSAADTVIFDTPPGHTPYLAQVLDVADQVVVVITPDAGSFMVLDQVEHLFAERAGGLEQGDYSYIVNQFDPSRTFCLDMLEVLKRRLGKQLIGVVPLDYVISEGLAFGTNPLLEDNALPAREEILSIGAVLKSRIHASESFKDKGRAS